MLNKNDLDNFIPIVLCAGFGTRLKPLTNFIPKVVCPIINKPVAFLSIEIFFKVGFEKVHCNTHYLDYEVRTELTEAAKFYGYDPSRIVFWHEDEILETGGGIARIYHEVIKLEKSTKGKDAIIVSGDIAADFPLEQMINTWKKKQPNDYALMCTRDTEKTRKDATWVTKNNEFILGFGGDFKATEETIAKVFTTHQILSKDLLNIVEVQKKSSIEIYYKKAMSLKKNILNFCYPNKNYWFDIGTPQSYLECINYFEKNLIQEKEEEEVKKKYYEKSVINFCFKKPPKINNKIIQNNVMILHSNDTKIVISFRENNKNINLVSLNEFCSSDEKNSSDDFYILL